MPFRRVDSGAEVGGSLWRGRRHCEGSTDAGDGHYAVTWMGESPWEKHGELGTTDRKIVANLEENHRNSLNGMGFRMD